MGLLDKVKNLFTEEVDEPEEKIVKKEPKKEIKKEIFKKERTVEIAPARKETADFFEKEFEEKPVVKAEKIEIKEDKPSSLLFSDDAFSDLPTRKESRQDSRQTGLARDIYREINTTKYTKKEEPKKDKKASFKPSPIISPVYGILDKNYKKDDISSKVTPNPYKSDEVTVDDVRNKAFGTLEDDLENTLIREALVKKEEVVEDSGINIFEELETNKEITDSLEKQKQQIEEKNEIIKSNVKPEDKKVTSRKIDNILEELDEIEELIPAKNKKKKIEDTNIEDDFINTTEEVQESKDELEEGDLFNLIDSMYEKRDE